MLVSELTALIDGTAVIQDVPDREITCGYSCDLLSWVMAQGKAGCAWVTVVRRGAPWMHRSSG